MIVHFSIFINLKNQKEVEKNHPSSFTKTKIHCNRNCTILITIHKLIKKCTICDGNKVV